MRFLNFEREHLRRYREGHPHDLGPLPGWAQCLTAFRNEALLRNQGRGAAELAKRYRQSLGRIPSSGPVLRTLVPGQSDISPIPEDEMMPTYRLLAEIEAAMDAERIAARQAPAEDTPEAPFGLPPDAPKAAAGLSTRHLPRPRRTPWLSKSPSGCGRTSQRAEPRMPRTRRTPPQEAHVPISRCWPHHDREGAQIAQAMMSCVADVVRHQATYDIVQSVANCETYCAPD